MRQARTRAPHYPFAGSTPSLCSSMTAIPMQACAKAPPARSAIATKAASAISSSAAPSCWARFDVILDTPHALGNMRRRHCHQFLGLGRQRAVLEDHLVEIHEALEQVRLQVSEFAKVFYRVAGKKFCHLTPPVARI